MYICIFHLKAASKMAAFFLGDFFLLNGAANIKTYFIF